MNRGPAVYETRAQPFNYLTINALLTLGSRMGTKHWSRRRDLNSQPRAYEARALPLSYFGSFHELPNLLFQTLHRFVLLRILLDIVVLKRRSHIAVSQDRGNNYRLYT